MKRPRFLLLAALFALALASPHASAAYFYNEIEGSRNLPPKATCIFAQTKGYIWVGTEIGLVRVSPSEGRLYTASAEKGALPGNMIYNVNEDPDGRIWIFTDKGTVFYNPVSDSFERLVTDTHVIYCSLSTSDGFYGGGANRVFKYTGSTGRIAEEVSFQTPEPFTVEAIFPAKDGALLLVNNAQGVLAYYPAEKDVRPSRLNVKDSRCIFVDSYGRFWRSAFNKGLECYDSEGNLLKHFTTDNSELSSNVILCITQQANGDVWVGTDGGGIDIISPSLENFTILGHASGMNCTLPDNSINVLHSAQDGNVWAAKSHGGLLQVKDCNMRSYFLRPSGVRTVNVSDIVNCLCRQEDSQYIWFGSHGSGLVRFDLATETLRTFTATEDYEIVSIANLPGGRLLFSALNNGLYIFDTNTNTLSDFPIKNAELNEWIKFGGATVNVAKDMDGQILIFGENVFKYDPATQRLTKPDLSLPHNPDHHVNEVYNSKGRYFVCEDNITQWTSRTNTIDLLIEAPQGTEFRSAAMGVDGSLWIATSTGLANFNPVSGKYNPIHSELFSSARSVICSDDGKVWVGTDGYLFVYLPGKGSFVSFDEFDGVGRNNFGSKCVAGAMGKIVMSGDNGYTIIETAQNFNAIDTPALEMADLYVDGERMKKFSGIYVPYSHNEVKIGVLARENNTFRKKSFKFRVKGPGSTTETITDQPVLASQYGRPGRYRVSAACTLKDGSWSDFQDLTTFKVESPWILSWWFLTLLFVAMGALFLLISKYGTLRNAATESNSQVKFLLNVSHELKTPLTLIINPLTHILDGMDKSDKNYSKLSNILSQAQRMKELILTVLSSHRIEEGSSELIAEPLDFNSWANSIVSHFNDEAEINEVHLKTEYDPSIGKADIDGSKLEHVISNILINAFKHSSKGSEIIVGTRLKEDGQLRFYVKDRGPGLQNVDTQKLFSRYYQGITEKTGSGMGLAYAKAIVKLHDGLLGAENNTDGAGATFYFDIPLKQSRQSGS